MDNITKIQIIGTILTGDYYNHDRTVVKEYSSLEELIEDNTMDIYYEICNNENLTKLLFNTYEGKELLSKKINEEVAKLEKLKYESEFLIRNINKSLYDSLSHKIVSDITNYDLEEDTILYQKVKESSYRTILGENGYKQYLINKKKEEDRKKKLEASNKKRRETLKRKKIEAAKKLLEQEGEL